MASRLRRSVAAVPLVLALGCGAAVEGGAVCTEIGAPAGVGVTVVGPAAEHGERVRVRVCWDGSCTGGVSVLRAGTTTVDEGCDGDGPDAPCSARVEPDGSLTGFVSMDLPDERVTVTARVTDRTGRALVVGREAATPRATYPNGRSCPAGGRQVELALR